MTTGEGGTPSQHQKGCMTMTKSAIKREMRNVRYELEWLAYCERVHDPEWRFMSQPYSKRRARLVRTYWALNGLSR